MQTGYIQNINDIPAEAWNALVPDDAPFVRHEFLLALEETGCASAKAGWEPHHVLILDDADDGRLLGAMPLYVKYNSYGEYVFDWAWADAYERAGLDYYPKLMCSVPFTPVTGPRLLTGDGDDAAAIGRMLIQGAITIASDKGLSSAHWLFTDERDTRLLEDSGLMLRSGSQFHWSNDNYADFDDYLKAFSSKRRKNIRRERRRVADQGIVFDNLTGDAITEEHWNTFFRFYRATIDIRGAHAYLSRDFFTALGTRMKNKVLLTLAKHEDRYVAGALNLIGENTLYGRYWGSSGYFDDLHFETCYYQGIEYCIDNSLGRFEAGAQGEHKLNRGLLPVTTWSAHWISHPQFANAIDDFLEKERKGVDRYVSVLQSHSPFRQPDAPSGDEEAGTKDTPDSASPDDVTEEPV